MAREQTAALMGIEVQPAARPDTERENMKRATRSSRNSGYFNINAITSEFITMFAMMIALMTIGFMSPSSNMFVFNCKARQAKMYVILRSSNLKNSYVGGFQ